jgi:hypothetical protein
MIFASAPEPVDGVAHVWLENGSGVLAELLPSEARDLAADLLAAGDRLPAGARRGRPAPSSRVFTSWQLRFKLFVQYRIAGNTV